MLIIKPRPDFSAASRNQQKRIRKIEQAVRWNIGYQQGPVIGIFKEQKMVKGTKRKNSANFKAKVTWLHYPGTSRWPTSRSNLKCTPSR